MAAVMASWKRVAELFRRLEKAGLDPTTVIGGRVLGAEAGSLPPTVDSRTLLQGRRLQQKRDQVANLLALTGDLPAGSVAVDFGAGSGHLSLPLAYLHPDITVWLVDLNEYGLGLARKRADEAGLANVRFFAGQVTDFSERFDIGFALHACGEASDEAQERCLAHGANYIVCPCDLGKIQNAHHPFPRSARFRELLSREEYNTLAAAADWTNVEDVDRRNRGARAMAYVNLDRNLAAEEVGYDTLLLVGYPLESTPKNQIIYGALRTP
ncbi:MAG: methyltransferase domain-containing protein [Planctomycetes bacterium]|nr:methyltransferase domain-containing protein [Planctomycetota bacterium]